MAYIRCSGTPGGSLKVRTASGAIASFETNLVAPLQALTAEIAASGGNGTPSTPIPIVGHSELNLVRCGINILDYSAVSHRGITATKNANGSLTLSGIATGGTAYVTDNTALTLEAGSYTFSVSGLVENVRFVYTKNGNYGGEITGTRTITLTERTTIGGYVSVVNGTDLSNPITLYMQLELGSTATAYTPYIGTQYLVSFGQTVYGGEYDANRGKVRITWGSVDLGSLTWYLRNETATRQAWNTTGLEGVIKSPADNNTPYNALAEGFTGVSYNGTWLPGTFANSEINTNTIAFCSNPGEFANADEFKASVTGHLFVYELATPIEIDVSELSVDTIVGVNNVSHDGNGDTEVKYLYKA